MEGLSIIVRPEVGCEFQQWAWQVGEIEGFDETLRRADFAIGSRAQESMQLPMWRRIAVLRHRLEASKRVQLGLFLDDSLHCLYPEGANQFVFEVVDAREKSGFLDRATARDEDFCFRERSADMPFVGGVVHAADVGTRVSAQVRGEHVREVRDAAGRKNVDAARAKVATDAGGQRPHCVGIAFALDEHQPASGLQRGHAKSV